MQTPAMLKLGRDGFGQRSVASRVRSLALWQPLAGRDFRALWLGQTVSLLGDQFYLVALLWLTYQVTGSGLKTGTVFMTATIPRTVLPLVGGAASDRLSPRRLLLISNLVRAAAVLTLAALIFSGPFRFWQLYPLAFILGTADAFFYPSFRSFIPALVSAPRLPAANALMQFSSQGSRLIGPLMGSLLIAKAGGAAAFGFDSLTFIFAALTLLLIKGGADQSRREEVKASAQLKGAGRAHGLWATIGEGLSYAWRQPTMRAILILIAVVEFSIAGPFVLGLPALARLRFEESTTALGLLLSCFGGGALVGTFVASNVLRPKHRFAVFTATTACLAATLVLLGFVTNLALCCLTVAAMGVEGGTLPVIVVSWLQAASDAGLRGRVMSLMMIASDGLAPLSYAVAGAVIDRNLTLTFVAAGALIAAAFIFLSRSLSGIAQDHSTAGNFRRVSHATLSHSNPKDLGNTPLRPD